MGKSNKRFSYLLMDEGEFYIHDWMAVCRSGPPPWQHIRLKGRLRLCSKSIFFDPDNLRLPITMFPLKSVKRIEGVSDSPISPSPVNSKWSRRQEAFLLETTLFVKMKEGGLDAPYVFEKQESKWWFSLEFAPVQQFISQAQSLLSINCLAPSERDMILQNSMAQREAQGRFDTSRLSDLNESILIDCPAAQILPLVREPGRLVLTQTHLYFQPLHNLNNDSPVRSQPLNSIVAFARRRHALCQTGLEVFFTELDWVSRKKTLGSGLADAAAADDDEGGGSALFTFGTLEERDSFVSELLKQLGGLNTRRIEDAVGCLLEADSPWLEQVTHAWQEANVSNYDYLMYLNLAAGRSFCDLSQWPVMPWILKDYQSQVLDLNNANVFRDLSKPIGALNSERLRIFKDRYAQMAADEGGSHPPFLYGTHYSTPGYVLYWLVRLAPAHMLRLQNGRFDAPDRLFVSIKESWESVLNNPADVKELIPEFFSHPGDFLVMREGLNLGVRQGGEIVGDVLLPPWAASPNDFIQKHREALECEHVSRNLHLWIDLIFGCKQRGQAALLSDNLFHHLTYEGSVDLEAIADPVERASLEAQIHEFGQAPQQLFSSPHPAKRLTKPFEIPRSDSGTEFESEILHKELCSGLNPRFLSRIMNVIAPQNNQGSCLPDMTKVNASVLPHAPPNDLSCTVASSPLITSAPAQFGQISINPEVVGANEEPGKQNMVDNSFTSDVVQGERVSRALCRVSDELKLLRVGSARSAFSSWYSWSPASRLPAIDREPCIGGDTAINLNKHEETSSLLTTRSPLSISGSFSTIDEEGREMTEDRYRQLLEDETNVPPNSWHMSRTPQFSKMQSLQAHRGPVKSAILSENASGFLTLYSAGQDGVVKVYSLVEGSQIRSTKLGNLPLSSLALAGSCDHYPLVLAGSYDNCLYAYSVEYGKQTGKMRVHEETVSCVKAIDSHLRRLVTASWDATVKIWSVEEGRDDWITSFGTLASLPEPACVPESQFLEHDSPIFALDVEQAGQLVLSGDEDGAVIAWDIRNPTSIIWQHHGYVQGAIAGIRLVPNSPKVTVASGEGNVCLLDLRKEGRTLAAHNCGTHLRCIEATSDFIMAGSASGILHTFSVEEMERLGDSGNEEWSFSPTCDIQEAINSISICVDQTNNRSLAAASDDGCVHLYSL